MMHLRNKVKRIFIDRRIHTIVQHPTWRTKTLTAPDVSGMRFGHLWLTAVTPPPPRNCPQLKGTGSLRSHTRLGAASILCAPNESEDSEPLCWGIPTRAPWDCLKPFTRLHYTLISPYCLCWFLHFLTGTVLNSPINFLQTNLHLKICFPGKQPKTVGARGDWRGNQWCAGTC